MGVFIETIVGHVGHGLAEYFRFAIFLDHGADGFLNHLGKIGGAVGVFWFGVVLIDHFFQVVVELFRHRDIYF